MYNMSMSHFLIHMLNSCAPLLYCTFWDLLNKRSPVSSLLTSLEWAQLRKCTQSWRQNWPSKFIPGNFSYSPGWLMTTVLCFPWLRTVPLFWFFSPNPQHHFPSFALHFLFAEKIGLQNRTLQTPTGTPIHFSAAAPTHSVFLLLTYEHTMSCDPAEGHPSVCAWTLPPPSHTGSTSVSPCLWHNDFSQFPHSYSPNFSISLFS